MYFEQFYLGCLAHASYMLASEGEAIVIDPQRDVEIYLTAAAEHDLKIRHIFETHLHADFVSGHKELAERTGATIYIGPHGGARFTRTEVGDGFQLRVGKMRIDVLNTPGHTPESICLVVTDEEKPGKPWAVFTGDTLFIGDVGRPDLLSSAGVTASDLARSLYRSLHGQLLTLPDGVRVFPAHGAGSACGKNLSTAAQSTIGEQRATNYALQPMAEEDFVAAVTTGQSVAPPYFGFAARANRSDHELLDDHEEPPVLGVEELARRLADGAVLIDGRTAAEFASGHLRGAVNVGMEGRFAEYAGDVARPDQPLVLVTEPGREAEARVRLARIGFDRVVGAVGGVERVLAEHPELAEASLRLTAGDFFGWHAGGEVQVVDVRNPGEQEGGVIPGAVRIPLAALLARIDELDPAATTVVYCAGGYRSIIAASALSARGFARVADIVGGYDAWKAAGYPTVAPTSSAAP